MQSSGCYRIKIGMRCENVQPRLLGIVAAVHRPTYGKTLPLKLLFLIIEIPTEGDLMLV